MTMRRIGALLLAAGAWMTAMAAETGAAAAPNVSRIVEQNVAARGGLEAWRKIQTMVWIGHIESASAPDSPVTFVMQMKRPDKMRFEVTADNEKSIRAFDGNEGWKVRPPRGGKAGLLPFSPEEVRFARDSPGIDGPLIDHGIKGIGVDLEGTDEVEGRKAYRLAVKLPTGSMRRVWIDTETHLEVKYERESRDAAGRGRTVSVFYRNYKTVEGLKIPMAIETGTGAGVERLVLDRVLLNPPVDDAQFGKPRSASLPGLPPAAATRSGS
jgi:outer membrane lipoprotein-sorting protein